MGKIKNKLKYPVKFPLDVKDYVVGTDRKTGKTISIELGALMNQSFDLGLLGQKCIEYPVTTSTDCETGETVQLPLQLAQVLLTHESILCQLLEYIQQIQNDCCDDCDTVVKTTMIYNENNGEPDEWDATIDSSLSSLVVLDSNNDAQIGDKSIYYKGVTSSPNAEVFFKGQVSIVASDVKELRFYIKHLNTTNDYGIKIVFLKNGQEGSAINITDGLFGFSMSNVNWNEIIIPLTASMFPDVDFDEMVLSVTPLNVGEDITDVNIDNIRIISEETDCSGNTPNVPPTVNAGADQTITLPTSDVVLSATANDSDGNIVSYLWELVSGGTYMFDDATSQATQVTGLQQGTYVFRVTVTDDDGATASDLVTVTVNPENNNAPNADAGSNQTINLPSTSSNLDGSNSSDSDGNIVSHSWTQISGNTATITSPNSATTSITGLSLGTYIFQLTVTDDDGATDTDTVTIVVAEEQLVPVQIEIDLGNCSNPADFVNTANVYILKTQTEINTGFIQINNGDILYSDSNATSPFNGGGNGYMYRGIPPNQIPNESFVVSSTGVVSAHQVCPTINQLNKTVNFDYNSANVSQNGHYHTFTLAELTSGTASTNGIQNIRILTLPNRGELAGQGNPITSTPTDFSETNISGGSFEMWGDDTDGQGQAGSYTTQFTYAIVDNNGNDTDIVTMTLNATDLATAPTELQITAGKCSADLTNANWTTVYIPNGGTLGNGTVVFTDQALTQPYNGGGTFYRFQTPQGLVYNFQYNVSTTGVVSNAISCGISGGGNDASIISQSSDNCGSCMAVQVTVPQGETRTVTISKNGIGGYGYQGSNCLTSPNPIVSNMTETISGDKVYTFGIDAATGNQQATTTITLSVSGGNSVTLSRTHSSPVQNC